LNPAGNGADISHDGGIPYNVFDVYVTSFTGADNVSNASITSITGTFSSVGAGALLAVPGDGTTRKGVWTNFITGDNAVGINNPATATGSLTSPPSGYASSFVNLGTMVGTSSRSGTGNASYASTKATAAATAINGQSASFSATWGAVSPQHNIVASPMTDGSANNLLAEILVTAGGDIAFSGAVNTAGSSGANSINEPLSTVGLTGKTTAISLTATAAQGVSASKFTGTSNPTSASTGVINVIGSAATGYRVGQEAGGYGPTSTNLPDGPGGANGGAGTILPGGDLAGAAGNAELKFQTAGGTATDPGTEVIALAVKVTGTGNLQNLITDANDAVRGFGPTAAPGGTLPASLLSSNASLNAFFNGSPAATGPYNVLIQLPTSAANGGNVGDSFLSFDMDPTYFSELQGLQVTAIAVVPEPANLGLAGASAGLMLMTRRGRRRRTNAGHVASS
jgi:hypothetical protein